MKHPVLTVFLLMTLFEGVPLLGPIAMEKVAQARHDRAMEIAGYTNRGSNFQYILKKN